MNTLIFGILLIRVENKHCQRNNGPESWVLRTKVTYLGHKFLHKSCSHFIFRISTKHQLQNLSQTSSFLLNLNFKISTKSSFRISTKITLHNLKQASAANSDHSSAKSRLNFNLKILTKPCVQSLKKFNFLTKLQLPNPNQTVANTFLSINISNSNNLNTFWAGIFTSQGHIINQV